MTNRLKLYWALSLIGVSGASFTVGCFLMLSRFDRYVSATTYETTPTEIAVWLKACSNSEEAIRNADPMFKRLVTANLAGISTRAAIYAGTLQNNGMQSKAEDLKAEIEKTLQLKERLGKMLAAQ
jgi:hypothetical protein